jgi:hypothetical protein
MAQGLLGGVLPAIYSGADQLKRGVYGLLTNPMEQAERAGQSLLQSRADRQALMARTFANPDRPFQVTDQAGLAQLGNDVLMGELGFAPAGITAWHGSPHTFNRFDISKVGTGEGAQVYGHGMYFAEAPAVAKQYADELGTTIGVNGKPLFDKGKIVGTTGNTEIDDYLVANLGNADLARNNILNDIREVKATNPDAVKHYENLLIDLDKHKILNEQKGNLYKVDIPDEYVPKMLSWDKPLREQPEILKTLGFDVKKYDKLKAQRDAMPEKFDIDIPEELAQYNKAMALEKEMREMPIDFSGKYFYESLIKKYGTQKAISEALSEKGIKGIQYLDAGSRGKATERSSNFVVFDPTNVKILERNNQPVEGLLGN